MGEFLESQPIVIVITSVEIVGDRELKVSSGSWFPVGGYVSVKL